MMEQEQQQAQEGGGGGSYDVRHTGSFGPPPDDDLIRSIPTLDL